MRELLGVVMQYRAFHPEVSRSNPFQIRNDQQLLNVCFWICTGVCKVLLILVLLEGCLLQDLLIHVIDVRQLGSEYFMNIQKYRLIYSTEIIRVVIICPFVG